MAGLSCCSLPSTETMKSRHRVPSWTLESNSIREDKKLIGKYHFKNQYNIFHEINKTRRGHIWHKNYKRFPLIDDACRLGLLAQSVVNVRRTGGFFFSQVRCRFRSVAARIDRVEKPTRTDIIITATYHYT